KALADAQANAAKVRAAVRSRVIKGMRSRGNAGVATGANVATTGLDGNYDCCNRRSVCNSTHAHKAR
ncbi:hypothetical protein HMPREF1586_01128, partial [Gardnerella vaginalis JCP8522]